MQDRRRPPSSTDDDDDGRPSLTAAAMPEAASAADQRVLLHGLDWSQYESMQVIRGARAGVRMTYLEGALELMSTAVEHEKIKKCIARLIEAYADEHGLELDGYGTWPLRSERGACGAEPDECYVLGKGKSAPDLVVDVLWTEGGLDRLAVYQRLGIAEVWVWTREGIEVHRLRAGGYVQVGRSEIFPKLDLGVLASFIRPDAQTRAVRSFREALRGDGPSPQKPAATGPTARQP
ncbi:MAG TPA: Uma2 family endonuclease [Haliangium sp.]|nr:Uma2 family endonuclease [Haliangium sp.]